MGLIKKNFFPSLFLFATSILGATLYFFEYEWVDFSTLERFDRGKPSVVLDDAGNEFLRFELDRREPTTFDQLPSVLVSAFVAAEDHKFFNHCGISVKGMVRSLLVNLRKGRVVQGASTITQQVARGMFLSYEQKLWRKIREIVLSFQLEWRFTKEQIFELYINNMYFGRGIYGVEAACRRFWNKSVKEISLDEAAVLASVAKSARWYSPLNAPENAKRRRNIVLRSMCRLNFISQEQYEAAREKELVLHDYLPGDAIRLYIQEHIRLWAEKRWGKDALYQKGLRIQTTISREKQKIAEELFCKQVKKLREKVGASLNGGMLSIEPWSGKIKTLIGGYNFRESQYNRAFRAVRQMGSSFKPIVYTAAILAGIDVDTVMRDEPIEMQLPGCPKVWKPQNWTRTFEGPMTLARALSHSNNMITIKTLLKVGMEPVIALANKFGLNRALRPYPSLALGTAEATVEENVAAFNVFANNGFYVSPYLISWVKDCWGKKLWEHEGYRKKVLDGKTNSKMINLLSLRLQEIAMRRGKRGWIGAEVIGKSGSTNGAVSTWYVGATPELTTSVYLGRDDNKPMGRYVFGSQTAFPIWLDFYKQLKFTKKQFYSDPELQEVAINWLTGYQTYDRRGKDTVVILK